MVITKYITTLALLLGSSAIIAQTMTDNARNYKDRMYLNNIFAESANPVTANYYDIPSVADFNIGYSNSNGELNLIDGATNENWWNVSIFGIKKFDRLSFVGGIEYNNGTLDERRWNNTLFVSQENPYIICDSIKSSNSTELFNLHGTAAYRLTDKFNVALRALYNVGSSATQKDPRSEIKGMRFRLNPGVDYRIGKKITLGLSGDVEWMSESVSHSVVRTDVNQYVFLFQGLGNHESKAAIGYSRKYTGLNYGADIQLVYKDNTISDFLEVGYQANQEKAEDGSGSTKYNGGQFDSKNISLRNRFEVRKGALIHNVDLSASMVDVEGTWSTQRQVTDDNGNLYWNVVNKSVEYKATEYHANIDYRIDYFTHSNPSITAILNIGLNNSSKRNTLYAASQKYTEAIAGLSVSKYINIKRGQLKISINGGYQKNLDNSLSTDEFPASLQLMMTRYTKPAFEAIIADKYNVGAGVNYNIPIKINRFSTLLAAGVSYQHYGYAGNSASMSGKAKDIVSANISMTF
ncbi:MAG: hypothetical protein PHR45_03235 [Muribaculaceae bacterium]|nr:hypothetical protein [Muribaculaceae bacterium]